MDLPQQNFKNTHLPYGKLLNLASNLISIPLGFEDPFLICSNSFNLKWITYVSATSSPRPCSQGTPLLGDCKRI